MPSVDGKEFPYTPKGMRAAAKARRMKPSTEDASGRMAQRGLSKQAGTKGRKMPRKPRAMTPREKEALEKMVPLKPKNPRKRKKDELTIPDFMKNYGKSKKISKTTRRVVPKAKKKMG
jgi:hypothetical protein